MTSEEFIAEVKKSSICPADFDSMMNLIKKYQTLAVNTLKEFDRVCRKNGIKYQLAYGSLLGAVRDNGMIPWDYDVDVFVFNSDRQKLISALEKNLDAKYSFNSIEHNSTTQGTITRIAPVPYKTDHLHVDVFYLAGVSADEEVCKKECAEIRRCCYVTDACIPSVLAINPIVHPKGWLRSVYRLFRYSLSDKKKAVDRYFELVNSYDEFKSRNLINANSFAGTYFMPAENMKDVIDYQTSLGIFSVPERYDDVLRTEFGSYMEVPSLSDRVKAVKVFYKMFLKMERMIQK